MRATKLTVATSNMDILVEERYAIKFCRRLKKNTVETILLLQEAFGKEVLGVSIIKRRHKMFLYDRESAGFEPWCGKSKIVCSHISDGKYPYFFNNDIYISIFWPKILIISICIDIFSRNKKSRHHRQLFLVFGCRNRRFLPRRCSVSVAQRPNGATSGQAMLDVATAICKRRTS